MKAPGIIMVVGGLGALALLGLTVLQRPEPVSEPASASGAVPAPRAAPASGAAPAPAVNKPASAAEPQPVPGAPAPRAPGSPPPSHEAPTGSSTPGAMAAEPVPAEEAAPPAEAPPPPVPAEVAKRLTVARQSANQSERLSAVKWLGEHADVHQFEALQQIQMQDPDPAVRRAAEDATNALRIRHADKKWPGVPRNANPQDYMRDVPEPPR